MEEKVEGVVEQLPPGTIVERGAITEHKVPWTVRDVWDRYETVEFYAYNDEVVGFQGTKWLIRGGETNKAPSIIRDIYLQSIDAKKKAEKAATDLYHRTDKVGALRENE